ncbi:MAG: hypothetical protein JSV43_06445 [Methanobacteriota archaeon]|nr:MAG: hypothetical protein JSV43_06445 [Euryarchaeota archaeon]
MRLQFVVERKLYYYGFTFGLSIILVLLDYMNPFVNFFETWNMRYVINNLGWFMIFLIPIFFSLGVIAQWDGMSDLFFACVLIPIYYFLLKGLLFLFLIAQDPNLTYVIGSWFGGYILDWRDFSIIYLFSLPLFMAFVWRYCLGFLVLGYIASHFLGKHVRNFARAVFSRLSGKSEGGLVKDVFV